MVETIVLYYTPLASTKAAAVVGLGLAYHVALVYTNSGGESFGVSAGPSRQISEHSSLNALRALLRTAVNAPSAFGTLISDPQNNHAFLRRHPEDYYTQDDAGEEYPHTTALAGRDLSVQWRIIVRAYATVDRLSLTYSPITQNSNSVAGMALRRAGIPMPFSSATRFAPGTFTRMPGDRPEHGRQRN